jgi:hypothetical protein
VLLLLFLAATSEPASNAASGPSVRVEGHHDNGRRVGVWRTFFENGQLESEGAYADDLPVGRWTYWYPNGQKKLEGAYEHGERSGVWTEFDEQGQKRGAQYFEHGALRGVWDAAGKEVVLGERHVHFSLGVILGWSVGSTLVGLQQAPPVIRHYFAFSGRPELLFTPRMIDVGLGIYAEVGTQKTFRDTSIGGGVLLRLGTQAIKAAPWLGAYARSFNNYWEPGVSGGLFVGIHDHRNPASMASGLRVDLRHTFGPERELSFTLGLQLDLTLLMLPLMIIKGGTWFARG